jgi:hypothetical protein
MRDADPIQSSLDAFAALNPVPSSELPALERAPERARTLSLINAHRNGRATRTPIRLRAAVAGIALTAMIVPALAFSGQLRSLFGFTNQGNSVDTRALDLRTATALDTAGATGSVKLLASRAGIGLYLAHGEGGKLCLFVGPPNGPDERGLSGGCMNAAASASFPSPALPIIDMSAFFYKPRAVGEGISRLAGVAADGVAKIQIVGLDCQVIAEAPVMDNIYARTDLPETPAVAIVGLSHDGKRVYLNKLRFWDKSACAATRSG